MMQLSTFLWSMVAMFAVIGFLRGWTREIVATAGIILALFALTWFVLVFSVTALFAPKGTPKDIVAKLNALMDLCDQLEAHLAAARSGSRRWTRRGSTIGRARGDQPSRRRTRATRRRTSPPRAVERCGRLRRRGGS